MVHATRSRMRFGAPTAAYATTSRTARLQSVSRLAALVAVIVGFATLAFAAPWPDDEMTPVYRQAAETILEQIDGPKKGYCLVFGAGEGRLAHQIATRSEFTVLGASRQLERVRAGRAALHKADLYGDRITLHHQSLDAMAYRDYAAVLVLSDAMIAEGTCPGSAAEMFRMVRPDGGRAVLGQPRGCPKKLPRDELKRWLDAAGLTYTITETPADGLWATVTRGPLPGAGQWTHVRADVGNTACSKDGRTTDGRNVLWFGQPGPQIMIDRHWRGTSPLYLDGRLIVPAKDRFVCSDAYNGARLWDLAIPNSSRIAMMRDGGWLVLTGDHLYAAVENRCLKIDVPTGKIVDAFEVPKDTGDLAAADWGYLGVDGDRLLGSLQIPKASYLAARTGRGAVGNQLGRGNDRRIITSRALFCSDRHSGKTLWTYTPQATVIANVTICAGDGGVYFLESVQPAVVAETSGRVLLRDFTEGSSEFLVKLDAGTGRTLWRHQLDVPAQHVLHLCYADGVVLASSCDTAARDFCYHLRARRVEDGAPLWQRDLPTGFGTGDTDHGKQDKHPMIVGDTVYLKQGSFDLATGEPRGFAFKTSNCAECSASLNHVFGRMNSVASTWSLHGDGSSRPLSPHMRTGCYTSIIPAGGVVMMPPFSAGCTCPHTVQTTVVWLPKPATNDANPDGNPDANPDDRSAE